MNKYLLIGIAMLAFSKLTMAAQQDEVRLKESRERVVKQYVLDLQNADYKDITQLFEKDGLVISTSRGKVNAKDFFYSFLPDIATASTELHQYFTSDVDVDRLAARFHFSFKLKNGEAGEGEYVDEFIFSKNSAKLAAVYMFENLKFENNSNLLVMAVPSKLPKCPSVTAIQAVGFNYARIELYDYVVSRRDDFQTGNTWVFSLYLDDDSRYLTSNQAIMKGNESLSSLVFKSGPEPIWQGMSICRYSTQAGDAIAYQQT